jgi:hypothetical protein
MLRAFRAKPALPCRIQEPTVASTGRTLSGPNRLVNLPARQSALQPGAYPGYF